MKKIIVLVFISFCTTCFSQTMVADDIIGKYMSENNEGLIEVFKRGTKYCGKLIWNKKEGTLDKNNPNPNERLKPIRGKEILKDFVFDGTDEWEDGVIYDPKNGKTYSCVITREANGNLSVRGYIGISLIGRSTYWHKVK